MRRSLRIVIACIVTAAGVFATGVASAPASANDIRTLHFGVQFSPSFVLDLGEPGPSMGDQLISHDILVDKSGRQVGHDAVSCVITDPAGATGPEAECTATFALAGGQLATQFLNSPPPVKPLAVTGGTGAYRAVRGDGVLVENGDGTGTLTLRLIG